MNNQEIVLREIACSYNNGKRSFTQLELSKDLEISLSIVNNTVSNLRDINAVRVNRRSLEVISFDRLILYWATHRRLKKDIIYQTRASMAVKDIERNMPNEIAFTGYSAYRFLFDEAPADYSEVYVYATPRGLEEIKKRFEPNDKIPNVTVLRADQRLGKMIKMKALKHSSVCPAQIFVDLWNMREWYAKDFTDALAKRLGI